MSLQFLPHNFPPLYLEDKILGFLFYCHSCIPWTDEFYSNTEKLHKMCIFLYNKFCPLSIKIIKIECLGWCFWTVMLEKTLESPLDSKEIKPINPKGNQSWIFTERTDAELKLKYFGHLMQGADSLEKTLMLGKIEGPRRRGCLRMRWLDGMTWVCANSGR